ncbi:hypothetical protein ACFYU5_08530 [Nocardia aobensis]|uniref:Rad50/SbcC-type AAA domain-containing protein n=1 Tax=Nocardia aobensis TaxID=257277 RepID=A0ABW6P101_9NOCA
MSRITLRHLTIVGPDRPQASVEFDEHLTVIYGASDTGKSFIVDCIDYMLGARNLKQIPEAEGYTQILLGLHLPGGLPITLTRTMGGSKVDIHTKDIRAIPSSPPDRTLNVQHSAKAQNNISRYLLGLIGAEGRNLLKSQRGDVISLSFRNVSRLCVISETQMAAPRSPVLPGGRVQSETPEKSLFKYMLTGEDQPEGPTSLTDTEKKIGRGKIELLDQVIAETRTNLTKQSNEESLREQLGRLDYMLTRASTATMELITEQTIVADQIRTLQDSITEKRSHIGEVRTLLGRFDLLRQQYDSDLARLGMVSEAGNLLGYFRTGPCVFCGAAPEDQQDGHRLHETTQLQTAIAAETRKTSELRADLLTTIEDLESQLVSLEEEYASDREEALRLRDRISMIDHRLAPLNYETEENLAVRSQILTDLAALSQIQRLENLKADLSNTPAALPPARPDGIPATTIAEFERLMQSVLRSWKVPGDNRVRYEQNTAEIHVDGRARSSRGKGMRSVIHAAFTIALARHTTLHDLPHPGFVVLDSPILTYREPHERDTLLTHNVVEHFYRGLLSGMSSQVIVIENGDPPRDIDQYATVYAYRTSNSARHGFFPTTAHSR